MKKQYADKIEEEFAEIYGRPPVFTEREQFIKNHPRKAMRWDNEKIGRRIGESDTYKQVWKHK